MAPKKKKKLAAGKTINQNIKMKASPAKESVDIKKAAYTPGMKPAEQKEKPVAELTRAEPKAREPKEKAKQKKPKQKLKKMKLKKRFGIWRKKTAARVKTAAHSINQTIQAKRLPGRTEKIAALAALSVFIAAAVFLCIHFLQYKVPDAIIQTYTGMNESDIVVRNIEIPLDRQLQRAKETKAKGDKKAFKFFAEKNVTIEEWSDEMPLVLGNAASNKCIMLVTLLDKDDAIVYRSMGLKPGKYLPSVRLFNKMDYGEHELKMVVAGYDPKTYEKIGVQYMNFKLVIGVEQTTK